MANHEIFLLRHGPPLWQKDCSGNKLKAGPDAKLSKSGKKEIKKNVEHLTKENVFFDRIITSPFIRASQTADIYKNRLSPTGSFTIDSRLIDIVPPEEWDGKTSEEMRSLRHKDPTYDKIVIEDTIKFWDELKNNLTQEDRNQNIAIVSHASPISSLLYLLNNPATETVPHLDELEKSQNFWLERSEGMQLTLSQGKITKSVKIFTRTTDDVPQVLPCPKEKKPSEEDIQ